jgi:hypothetical protein
MVGFSVDRLVCKGLRQADSFYADAELIDACSGLMKPDTHLGENARQIEVSDDQTTPYLFR